MHAYILTKYPIFWVFYNRFYGGTHQHIRDIKKIVKNPPPIIHDDWVLYPYQVLVVVVVVVVVVIVVAILLLIVVVVPHLPTHMHTNVHI